MLTLLRRPHLAFIVVVVIFILIAIHLTSQPLSLDGVRSFLDGTFVGDYVGGSDSNSSIATGTSSASSSIPTPSAAAVPPVPQPAQQQNVLVVAKTHAEDTNWIAEKLPDWPTAIYTVDNQSAPLHTKKNKGHEASVYLTYIIDHYDNLPEIVIFIHSHQKHKHGTKRDRVFEGIDYDNFESISSLKLDFVKRNGFTNLRCMTNPGCPDEIQPFRPEAERVALRPQERVMAEVWTTLFPGEEVPRVLAAPCCAQFAVPASQIRQRPKAEYERFLNWVYETPLDDFTSGRVFEYLWHVIFGKDHVHCPDQEQCYVDQYSKRPWEAVDQAIRI
ncbi:hypothetical protein ACN47E_003796 [Coniothyrium glycines]